MLSPLILTAKMDADSFRFFDELRRLHFPPERNFLRAHITLFHHLPGEEIDVIEKDLAKLAASQNVIALDFTGVRFLGRGSAIEIDAPELVALRATLASEWSESLTAQDRQKFRPHITVQNKTEPNAAKKLFEELKSEWKNRQGAAIGLQLWHYRNGPWELAKEFAFKN